ncbi:LTA synthase family protein [Hyphomicrobium sp. CS1GBMeth3]|uniref:LTA synthase family protein n=1 Tax=Hyphomicrobium sp. CS1GBMeth3 TaxID=1892845 RepID=UPI001114F6DA|nr:LTA synthase family protein [Hyphomicrobium sp. CS1GBMeth3]
MSRIVKDGWAGYAASVVLAALYPTLFVLSQNWYALQAKQSAFLVAFAIVSGLVIYAIVEGALRLIDWIAAKWQRPPVSPGLRAIVFGVVCTVIICLLLAKTIKVAVPDRILVIAVYIAIGAVFVWAFRAGARRRVNAFLSVLSAVAATSWLVSTMDTSQSWIGSVRQDFEQAKFTHKPNIYLFIYDAYSSADAYQKVFDFDNSQHYADLAQRGIKVVHTFSNYNSTLQTAISVFLGKHHFYSTETGLADSQSGRPLLAGVVHNPVLATLKSNGYQLQYIHGIDYFVNEQGVLDYVFPDKPISSALRVFGAPLLRMKRKIGLEPQMEVLRTRLHATPKPGEPPWFTFAHVNLPAHSDMDVHWRQLESFEEDFRQKTKIANVNMLDTIDRIRAADPEAVILIFGDHGAHRYNRLADVDDPNAAFKEAGISPEVAALDDFGIMIAVGSGGRCDDEVYDGMTPVNMMRTLFACLADDKSLLDNRVEDIALYRGKERQNVFLTAQDGRTLPEWKPFEAPRAPAE